MRCEKTWLFSLILTGALALMCVVMIGKSLTQTSQEVLVSTDAVEVVQDGTETRITDAVTGQVYKLTTKRVRREEVPSEPYTVADTDTIKIEILPNGYRVRAGGMVYQITRKKGGWLSWLRK